MCLSITTLIERIHCIHTSQTQCYMLQRVQSVGPHWHGTLQARRTFYIEFSFPPVHTLPYKSWLDSNFFSVSRYFIYIVWRTQLSVPTSVQQCSDVASVTRATRVSRAYDFHNFCSIFSSLIGFPCSWFIWSVTVIPIRLVSFNQCIRFGAHTPFSGAFA